MLGWQRPDGLRPQRWCSSQGGEQRGASPHLTFTSPAQRSDPRQPPPSLLVLPQITVSDEDYTGVSFKQGGTVMTVTSDHAVSATLGEAKKSGKVPHHTTKSLSNSRSHT